MNQTKKAKHFGALHVKGSPLVLCNAWDAGSAKSILDAGAKAIATGSWSVAAAQGYRDGEEMPVDFVERIVARIVSSIDIPVSVDFEGGYSEEDGQLANNVSRLLDLGVIGIKALVCTASTAKHGASPLSVARRTRRASTCSSMRALICSSSTLRTRRWQSMKLSRGPKPMQPPARPDTSSPAWWTTR
jgi:hypothetical protein